MNQKADAYRGYTQAAILDMIRAAAEPLSKVDKITVVSSDGQGGTGAERVTADVAKIVAQAPAMVEALTGLKMEDMLARLVPPASAATAHGANGTERVVLEKKDGNGR